MDLDNKTVIEIWVKLYADPDLKLAIADNMVKYGGSFVKALSECLMRADQENLKKLIAAFKDYFIQYQPKNWKERG